MASKAAAAAKDVAAKARPNFRVGGTQVFLPNHVIKMLPPKRILSPYFATFQVPLRFNKLDLRDYLYHAYGVEVRSVRSWLTPQIPRRRYENDGDDPDTLRSKDLVAFGRGAWYRPQPIKRMMVHLVQPFVFPKPPPKPNKATRGTEDDPRAPWDYDMHRRLTAQQADAVGTQRRQAHDHKFRLRIEEDHVPAFRVGLAQQAQSLVRGARVWRGGGSGSSSGSGGAAALDPRWDGAADKETPAGASTEAHAKPVEKGPQS